MMGLIEALLLLITPFFSFIFFPFLNMHSLFMEAGKGLKISIHPPKKPSEGAALAAFPLTTWQRLSSSRRQ